VKVYVLVSHGSGWDSVTGTCKHGNEQVVSIEWEVS